MQVLSDLIARHKQGNAGGVTSICSAHPLVIEAGLRHAQRTGQAFVLFEATCNQVNQDGGYTGMKPADFVAFVHAIADRVGDMRQYGDGARRVVELAAAMVRHDDGIGPFIGGELGIFGIEDALDDELAGPALA